MEIGDDSEVPPAVIVAENNSNNNNVGIVMKMMRLKISNADLTT
jgi:hypothetical protein